MPVNRRLLYSNVLEVKKIKSLQIHKPILLSGCKLLSILWRFLMQNFQCDQTNKGYPTLCLSHELSLLWYSHVHHLQWRWSSASAMPTRSWVVDSMTMYSVLTQYQGQQDTLKHTWGTRCRTRWESLAASEGWWVSRAAGTPRADGHYLPWGGCRLFLLGGPDWGCWCCVCFKSLQRHQVSESKEQVQVKKIDLSQIS